MSKIRTDLQTLAALERSYYKRVDEAVASVNELYNILSRTDHRLNCNTIDDTILLINEATESARRCLLHQLTLSEVEAARRGIPDD